MAIPGACIGIFLGGCFLKRFELKPKGAVQFVLISNLICLACYGLLFFLGCDNLKMAGTTIPYYNSTTHTAREPFQVNLTVGQKQKATNDICLFNEYFVFSKHLIVNSLFLGCM